MAPTCEHFFKQPGRAAAAAAAPVLARNPPQSSPVPYFIVNMASNSVQQHLKRLERRAGDVASRMVTHWAALPLAGRAESIFKSWALPPVMRDPKRWSCCVASDPLRPWTLEPLLDIIAQCLALPPHPDIPTGSARFGAEHATAKCMCAQASVRTN